MTNTTTNEHGEEVIETYERPLAGWTWQILKIEDEENGEYHGRVYSPMVGEGGTLGDFTQEELDSVNAQKID